MAPRPTEFGTTLVTLREALTRKLCWTWDAAFQLVLPVWLASITHVPAPMNETPPPEIEQTVVAVVSMANATARPEVAVAVGV